MKNLEKTSQNWPPRTPPRDLPGPRFGPSRLAWNALWLPGGLPGTSLGAQKRLKNLVNMCISRTWGLTGPQCGLHFGTQGALWDLVGLNLGALDAQIWPWSSNLALEGSKSVSKSVTRVPRNQKASNEKHRDEKT